jgi:ABC-2 type transport system ATP-binding protein
MGCIDARGLRKTYGETVALAGLDLSIEKGRIVGLIGPNGAGKTTALNAMLGLISYQGSLRVLGCDPWTQRDRLMREVCFISDVAVLPRWIKVSQLLDFVGGIHPRFDRRKAESLLERTSIGTRQKVRELSKGMVTQLHLALVMAIDAQLLVLDEPTLGLDIVFRKAFYDSLLSDFLERERTVLLATHQVDEVEHVLTDVVFLDRGRVVFNRRVEELETSHYEVAVHPERLVQARALHPVQERLGFGRSIMLFEGVEPGQLQELGEVRRPSIADLFVAVMQSSHEQTKGTAQ